jgi:hypothetical protein
MTKVSKTFKTMKQATTYQNKLYSQYDYVQLVSFPMFSENGQYVWECKK